MASLLVHAFMLLPALALPIPSTSSVLSGPAPVFQPDPSGRGTIGLIVSCTTTFIICIWTSVHADIPPLHASDLIRFKYKAVWMVVCAAIPEGLIMCAFGQWLEARRIQEVWREAFKQDKMVPKHRKKISMEEAFFVVMGGITVCEIAKHNEKGDTPPIYYTSTLTPHGFKLYVKNRRVHHNVFEKRHIVDKGKGSNIAKAIACLQILWLVMQCITRKIEGLSITLLELHVVIQVACTIVTYALWWFKPLDVQQPILITVLDEPQLDDSTISPSSDSSSTESDTSPLNTPLLLPPTSLQGAEDQYKRCTQSQVNSNIEHLYITRKGPPECLPTLALAFHDIVHYLEGDLLMMLVESILTIPIGALHAIAWNVHFPTPLERWLWRVSSIAMCSLPVCIVFAAYWGAYQKLLVALTLEMSFVVPGRLKNLPHFLAVVVRKVWAAGKSQGRKHLFMIGVCLQLIGLYAVAVVYVTVESYISIRSPPVGAFLTPRWSNFVPHL